MEINQAMYLLIWLLMFLNASGTWTSWLILGPMAGTGDSSLLGFGLSAFFRQWLSFIGSIFAEVSMRGLSLKKMNLCAEIAIIIINSILLIYLLFFPDASLSDKIPIWAAVRYFVGGITLVVGFELLREYSSKETSLMGQLGLGQGSIILGSLFAFYLTSQNERDSAIYAISFDLLTSIIFFLFILLKLNRKKTSTNLNSITKTIRNRLYDASTILFNESNFNQSSGFLLGLAALVGLPSIFLFFSIHSGSFSTFSKLNLIFGIVMLVNSILFTKLKNSMGKIIIFSVLTFISFFCLFFKNEFNIYFLGAIFSLGSVIWLLFIHKLFISAVDVKHVGTTRTSMALYLNLIFGAGELATCWLLELGMLDTVIYIKTVFVVLSAIQLIRGRFHYQS
jgi:hypothetical protein